MTIGSQIKPSSIKGSNIYNEDSSTIIRLKRKDNRLSP
jgi:hypothetical protein